MLSWQYINSGMRLVFKIHYQTAIGQKLVFLITEEKKPVRTYPLSSADGENWVLELDYFSKEIQYQYAVAGPEGHIVVSEPVGHQLVFPHNIKEFRIYDVWNLKNFPENYLNNKVLKNLWPDFRPEKMTALRKHSHLFRLEAPLSDSNQRIIITGAAPELGSWQKETVLPLQQTSFGIWETALEIQSAENSEYKYGIQNTSTGELIHIETGKNRKLAANESAEALTVQADHYYRFGAAQLYHAAGVAVPVFSLRSSVGFGVGEFPDLELLGDWAAKCGLSMVQILPINDTTATHTWTDSYPYAAVSVYALHPLYLSLEKLTVSLPEPVKSQFVEIRNQLNEKQQVDYELVMDFKWKFLRGTFQEQQKKILTGRDFRKFLKENEIWLKPYAAFCVQRDRYKTPDFSQWKTHKRYISGKIEQMFAPSAKDYPEVMLHCWIQYELHLQLTHAVNQLHESKISLKGDLPIGIYRHSVEAWTEPELFNLDFQAGAPPDQFTDMGQNWEFPTYNWKAMKAGNYIWWKNRFAALEKYFDALRIDHILGFFRIWRIPADAVQGILGYFHPAIPVTQEEFSERNIPFDEKLFCRPFINEEILAFYFGEQAVGIKAEFFTTVGENRYEFKPEFDTQRKVQDYFKTREDQGCLHQLLSAHAEVLFLKEENNGSSVYHPRINLHETQVFRFLPAELKKSLEDLYHNYFFERQDAEWYRSALEKLPTLLQSTDMLICGEDLGMVPACVPTVMDELGIVALKVQRMSSENSLFYNPANASYLNVVTVSTHDSSTLRQWWQEDRQQSVTYFKNQLQQYATAPGELVPELAELILRQHLASPAMFAVFPLQDFLATDRTLRNADQNGERINEPAVFPHYWRYRMHIPLEELIANEAFSSKIAAWVSAAGRELF